MWRHVLLGMPVLGLGLFFVLPFTSALAIYLVIVFMSFWLYYKIMESMHAPANTGAEALTNRIVDTDAQGAIYWQGKWWTAAPKGAPRGFPPLGAKLSMRQASQRKRVRRRAQRAPGTGSIEKEKKP